MEKTSIRNEKLKICKSCDQYESITLRCKQCGCIMPIKTWIPGNTCPLKKHDITIKVENK